MTEHPEPPAAHRLAQADSVYLRLHAHQPVAWWPWGDEAFAEARRRDVPVLLSVGYATCHWCHVMARESFDDPEVAARMNDGFVSIKVDREARPDVDAVYMAALQSLTGGGGWPMTLALTPDGEPWFAGTYYPPEDRPGMPSFTRVLAALQAAWSDRRDAVRQAASEVRTALSGLEGRAGGARAHASGAIALEGGDAASTRLQAFEARALDALRTTFDAAHGGFGGAPKFPPHAALRFLEGSAGDEGADRMRVATLRAIVDGGVTDQLGGALHRYAVDGAWAVPHFEVMLVDQAQMLPRLAHAAAETDGARLRWGALAMLEAWARDLVRSDGLFATGLDAEAAGVEGAFHTWTPRELAAALPDGDDAAVAAALFGVGPAGPLEGRSVLHWSGADGVEDERVERLRAALLEARAERPAPRRDEPAVAAYVGLGIEGLAEAAASLPPEAAQQALALAERAADAAWAAGWDGERLRRSLDARPGTDAADVALLDDQVRFGLGCAALHRRTGEVRHLERALDLAAGVARHHALPDGGFATVPLDRPAPLVRARDGLDGALPAAETEAARLLAFAAAATGEDAFRTLAEDALAAAEPVARAAPTAVLSALRAARSLRAPALQVVIVGASEDPATGALLAAARAEAPGAVVVRSDGPDDPMVGRLPWLAGRTATAGRPTAYACASGVCRLPVQEPQALRDELRDLSAART
ncbi:MAG: thioredoxin domain-containing protein [Trueperaceae bacterium]